MSCLDQKSIPIPLIVQGEDKDLAIKLTDKVAKQPFDISAATEIVAIFLNTDNTFLEKKLSTSGIALINGALGQLKVILSAAETAALALSVNGAYSDIELHVTIAGKVTILNLLNCVNIIARRYPAAP